MEKKKVFTNINSRYINWKQIENVSETSSGSVFIVSFQNNNKVIIKAGSSVVEELYAHKLGEKMRVPIPKVRLIDYVTGEWSTMKRQMELKTTSNHSLLLRVQKSLDRAFFLIMEFVFGKDLTQLTSVDEFKQMATPKAMNDWGKLLCYDIIINNWDRFPCLWPGNFGNIMFSQDGDSFSAMGIDQKVTPLSTKFQVKYDGYMNKVKKFLELMQSEENIENIPEIKFSFIDSLQPFKIEKELFEDLRKGFFYVWDMFIQIKEKYFEDLKSQFVKLIHHDWADVWKTGLSMVHTQFFIHLQKIFKEVKEKREKQEQSNISDDIIEKAQKYANMKPEIPENQKTEKSIKLKIKFKLKIKLKIKNQIENQNQIKSNDEDVWVTAFQVYPLDSGSAQFIVEYELYQQLKTFEMNSNVVVFPEGSVEEMIHGDNFDSNKWVQGFKRICTKFKISAVLNIFHEVEPRKIFSRCIVIDEFGKIVLTYAKRHLVANEQNAFIAGKEPSKFHTKKFDGSGLLCHDIEHPTTVEETVKLLYETKEENSNEKDLSWKPKIIFNPTHLFGRKITDTEWVNSSLMALEKYLEPPVINKCDLFIVKVDQPPPSGYSCSLMTTCNGAFFVPAFEPLVTTFVVQKQQSFEELFGYEGRYRSRPEDNNGNRFMCFYLKEDDILKQQVARKIQFNQQKKLEVFYQSSKAVYSINNYQQSLLKNSIQFATLDEDEIPENNQTEKLKMIEGSERFGVKIEGNGFCFVDISKEVSNNLKEIVWFKFYTNIVDLDISLNRIGCLLDSGEILVIFFYSNKENLPLIKLVESFKEN
ncbi:actin-fragmin kinase -related [Anaeramoeba ignava]|uniref:Actin-fragmin kinase -related n=1 Tax=Anaeramoeba ignava TaxID=1746090 RepID=A0A9Q0RFJ9_ANAIG|nr:actin-fragmin kinase -related [Anaeramoeba ignava]